MKFIRYRHAFHIDCRWIYVDINMQFYSREQHMYHHWYKDWENMDEHLKNPMRMNWNRNNYFVLRVSQKTPV